MSVESVFNILLSFPRRELIVAMSVGVVVLSLVVQGTTMSHLLRATRVVVAPATPT